MVEPSHRPGPSAGPPVAGTGARASRRAPSLRILGRLVHGTLGALVGALFGLALTLAIVVALAAAGRFVFSLQELAALRWDTLSVPVGCLAGAWLAGNGPRRWWGAVARGLVGLAAGAAIGVLLALLLSGTAEGRWGGAVIGGVAGAWTLALRHLHTTRGGPREDPNAREAWVRGLVASAALAGLGFCPMLGSDAASRERTAWPPPRVELPDPADVESVIFLVGDAGATEIGRSPILEALRQDIEGWARVLTSDSAVSVVFLGDLVYPVGVRPRSHPEYARDSARLWNQIGLLDGRHARARGARGWFLAGNHDWGDMSGDEGRERIANLERELRTARSLGLLTLLEPPAGDPGPSHRDLGGSVRLVMLDTHAFLQGRSATRAERFGEDLRASLESAGERRVLLAAHHPYQSAGPHGVPRAGSHAWGIEFLLKKTGSLVQDLNSRVHAALRRRLRAAFREAGHRPLIFAGGHDHSLQVLSGVAADDPVHILVSGAGSKLSAVHPSDRRPEIAYAASRPGYMTLVVHRSGPIDLFVVAGDPDRLTCPEEGPDRRDCLVTGTDAYEIEFSRRLTPAGSP